ncbi:Utp20p NDAI_0A08230 [Naumovozyma dairenensis CBS 421]|uniref:Uncharacterized protein n=1 Tax=Naumovozyma dairenensis (strain ATCC 10597 / BCRC 20456 / CBS 421 / NBRC 0211 / NRRL Y-12639) TaxID=1071378 RepID=G0W588_NAUDC|nr:hypothetical protein NDAI_0A08230 [Naumovozyma dairenensis CBS 421]CCD22976.1 hypothetical protein NDAI_0A08230 [Naumovozyma dairenensis CBS 421]
MAKQKVTTKTTKRFRYSSFKAKIDDLKIEPARNLQKRVHDYVESSHFLASYEHWKDINLSAGFTNFSSEINNLVQTLPQILYHEEKIFNSLITYIDKFDEFSLQPLLDLLAQFCHDLGPDFMKFYERAVTSLIALLDSAIDSESLNIFEWGFNALAYIFKYLSRLLTDDLIPTFTLLFPLLSHKKEYLSRFSAEALSFLIRKANTKNLKTLTHYVFQKVINDEETNSYNGFLTLFTEALISTTGSLHSKAKVMLNTLIEESLTISDSDLCISLLCDIWMNISKHTDAENLAPIYDSVLELLDNNLKNFHLNNIVKLLSTMVFSESGKKVPDWSRITSIIQTIITHDKKSLLQSENVAFLFGVVLRNCDVKNITIYHKRMFDFYLEQYPDNFIEYFRFCLELCSEKVFSFNGMKYIQTFINIYWKSHGTKIALFLLDIQQRDSLKSKIKLTIPDEFISNILETLDSIHTARSEDLFDVYWRVIILKYSETSNFGILNPFTLKLLSNLTTPDDFSKDVVGSLIGVINPIEADDIMALLDALVANFSSYRNSLIYIEGLNELLNKSTKTHDLTKFVKSHADMYLELTDNMLLPDGKIRYQSLNLMTTLFNIEKKEFPSILEEFKRIEETPLSLSNARILTTRIRNLGPEFAKLEKDKIVTTTFLKCLFGLLTVRFSPLWDGVFEILPTVQGKDSELVWSNMLYFLKVLDEDFVLNYYEGPMQGDYDGFESNSQISRLHDTIHHFSTLWSKYFFKESSILDTTKAERGNLEYPKQIRTQTLKAMSLLPQLVERHSKDIIPYLFNQMEYSELFDNDGTGVAAPSAIHWQDSERNTLLKMLGKFKNIKSCFKAEEVHGRLLILLGSRSTDVQKLALDAILAYKDPILNKYRENLKNLLDDTLFRDEITKFLSKDESQVIEQGDEDILMPYVLRILFGRAQTPVTSGIKKGRKFAAISILPNLKEQFIIQFLQLGSSRFDFDYFFENQYQMESSEVSLTNMKKINGFVTILNSALGVLGANFPSVIDTVLRPLLYGIGMSYHALMIPNREIQVTKTAHNLRQQSLKCLNSIFQNLGESLNWSNFVNDIYTIVIKPRLGSFSDENLQQPSSLMNIMVYWATNEQFFPFLYHDNFASVHALMKTISSEHVKESVINVILEACNNIIKHPTQQDQYAELVAIVASTCLRVLPFLFKRFSNTESTSIATDLLLNMTESGFVQDDETKQFLIDSLVLILGDAKSMNTEDHLKILKVLSVLLENYNCSWNKIEKLYKVLSSLYKSYSDRTLRESLSSLFLVIGDRFSEMEQVSKLVADLNSFSTKRMQEYDFQRRLSAFKEFTENTYKTYSDMAWLPIIYTCLYFINDQEELAIRTNSTHTLIKFIDYINSKPTIADANVSISMLKNVILPALRTGLRKSDEAIQSEYINLLAYIVESAKYYKDLEDMKVLMFEGDEEANFFTNITHIQLHRRQRAIRRLSDHANELSDSSISHYLIPIVEPYAYSTEEKYRNIGNEALLTIGSLSNFMSWNQYKALVRRYVSTLKNKPNSIKVTVLLINQTSASLRNSLCQLRGKTDSGLLLRKLPNTLDEPERFITDELYPTLSKILGVRDDETIVSRIPLAEALVNFTMGLPDEGIVSLLPGILSKICQVLRSKSEDLREAVRSTLAKISTNLGPTYLTFIIKELISALQRGSQIHVLSFTVHHVLKSLESVLNHSDLDASAGMLVRVIMEDMFGTAGQEKDSDNYHSKMKEVKVNRSYDTAEVLSANISLSHFHEILRPIKALLMERINMKNQNKLTELLRRYSLGINHNEAASKTDVLSLCYEIFTQPELEARKPKREIKPVNEKEEFFLVNLNFKNTRVQTESSLYTHVMQKFALDLLRTVISRHKNLMTVSYLEGFIPLLKDALLSDNESLLTSTLRVLVILVKLDFSEESEPIFKNCARKVLNIIKDSPTTSSELCQMGLKFLSSFIRHKDIKLKDTALSYVLGKILPDLVEPTKQGLAFGFLKSLVSKHVRLPEIYDVINTVREVMVTNHSKEIRDVSRSVYYQFLMEYDQSKGRLEKQFKFMVDNLEYPSQEGRQSVMELINLIITKSTPELLAKLSSSFFISLANVSFNDDSPRCREMATVLLTHMFKVLEPSSLSTIEKYIIAWLKQSEDYTFLNLGLRVYKIYLTSVGLGKNIQLDELAINRIRWILSETGVGSEVPWDLIYTTINDFSTICENSEIVYDGSYKSIWDNIIGCLLYPHMWIRQSSSRLVSNYLIDNLDKFSKKFTDFEIQTICSRVLHQLNAPAISEGLAQESVKLLLKIVKLWDANKTPYVTKEATKQMGAEEEEPMVMKTNYKNAIDYVVTRLSSIVRSEENPTDSFLSKKSCIQLMALIIQVLNDENEIISLSEKIILPLYVYLEENHNYNASEEQEQLGIFAQECMQMLESKVPVSAFTKAYSNVKQIVIRRRQERKAKRATLAINAPDLAAQKKLRKHNRSREKRKHEKDDSGYYQRKNKKRRA